MPHPVAASSNLPSDPLRPAIEARSDAQPFETEDFAPCLRCGDMVELPADYCDGCERVSVLPLPLAHLYEVYGQPKPSDFNDGEPVPTLQAVAIFAGLVAGAAAGWALIYAAATLVATGQAMFL
jgi:hypothetical protein